MIKTNLKEFIDQFSLKKSWQEFNVYFFPGMGLVVASVLIAYIGAAIYGQIMGGPYRHADFLEVMAGMIEQGKRGHGNILTIILSFNLLVMAGIKMRKT